MDVIKFSVKKLKIVYHYYHHRELNKKLWWTDSFEKVVHQTLFLYYFSFAINICVLAGDIIDYIFSTNFFSYENRKIASYAMLPIIMVSFIVFAKKIGKQFGIPIPIDLSNPVRYKKYRNAAWLIRIIGIMAFPVLIWCVIKLYDLLEITFGIIIN